MTQCKGVWDSLRQIMGEERQQKAAINCQLGYLVPAAVYDTLKATPVS
jgi:hypothetical protein